MEATRMPLVDRWTENCGGSTSQGQKTIKNQYRIDIKFLLVCLRKMTKKVT